MQQLIARLRAEHLSMENDLRTLQLRVARRPVSRLALVDLLNLLDTRLLPHERLEDARLPRTEDGTPAPAGSEHARIAADRARLREGLAGWTERRKPDSATLDDLACTAEDLILCIIRHFHQEEERHLRPLEAPETGTATQAEA